MPEPFYIIAGLSATIDKDTTQLSLFNIVEGLKMVVQRPPKSNARKSRDTPIAIMLQQLEFTVVAVWKRGERTTTEMDFEFEIAVERPEDKREHIANSGVFRFEQPAHRFLVKCVLGASPESKSGILKIQSRIRKKGGKAWLRQDYAIPVDVTVIDAPEFVAANGTKTRKRKH